MHSPCHARVDELFYHFQAASLLLDDANDGLKVGDGETRSCSDATTTGPR
jgi:hypothetical protein